MKGEVNKKNLLLKRGMEILFVAILVTVIEYFFWGFNNIDFSYEGVKNLVSLARASF